MKLVEYQSLEEKKEYLFNGDSFIKSNPTELFEMLELISKYENYFYRGCAEAKYCLFNSAQRYFIINELYLKATEQNQKEWNKIYTQFVSNLITNCKEWNKSTVKKLLEANGINTDNDLAYLAYMQHFAVPTPLLDFTYNPYIALYFAVDNVSSSYSGKEINEYVSLYYGFEKHTMFVLSNDHFKKENIEQEEIIKYAQIFDSAFQLFSPKDKAFRILNNTNIINQEGLFVYNCLPFEPVEFLFRRLMKGLKEHIGSEKFEQLGFRDYVVGCLNIHKSMIPEIKEILVKKGITKEYLFPNTYDMKISILSNVI